MQVLFLSPHFDDAILSCGILMQRLVEQGHQVHILSLFVHGPEYTMRRQEDEDAVRRLSVSSYDIGLRDAPYRNGNITSIEHLVFGGYQEPERKAIFLARQHIQDFCHTHAIERIYAPLGVGYHIDHRLTFDIAAQLSFPCYFYEDKPYVFWRGALHGRCLQLGIRPFFETVSKEDVLRDISQHPFLNSFLPDAHQHVCLPQYLQMLQHEGEVKFVAMLREAVVPTQSEEEVLWMGLCAYRSQRPKIYPSKQDFLKENRSYIAQNEGVLERYWTIDPISSV